MFKTSSIFGINHEPRTMLLPCFLIDQFDTSPSLVEQIFELKYVCQYRFGSSVKSMDLKKIVETFAKLFNFHFLASLYQPLWSKSRFRINIFCLSLIALFFFKKSFNDDEIVTVDTDPHWLWWAAIGLIRDFVPDWIVSLQRWSPNSEEVDQ